MTARYDAVATTYAAGDDDYSLTATQALLGLIGDVAGQCVLDIACGNGSITRHLARTGAQAVGIDISSGLLDRARAAERAAPLGITDQKWDASTYLNSLADVGLVLERMVEPLPNEEFAGRSERAGDLPLYLAARCRLTDDLDAGSSEDWSDWVDSARLRSGPP
jgi:SAM-dependent methyltransferase